MAENRQNREEAEQQFTRELLYFVQYYFSQPGASLNLAFKDEDGHPLESYQAFPDTFKTWKTIKAVHDRRSLCFQIYDQIFEGKLQSWQLAERYILDCDPPGGLQILATATGEINAPESFTSLARAYCMLTCYPEALQNVQNALDVKPEHRRARILLADLYYITGKHAEAHQLYDRILEEKKEAMAEELSFQHLVGFTADILHSPIYAAAWLGATEQDALPGWEWAEGEFYYSPHFRADFAYYLLKQGKPLKACTKLVCLSREMPWYKEGVVNAYELIKKVDKSDTHFQADRIRLEEIMAEEP